MFKFMWMAHRRKLVPIITAFLRAADAEILWRVGARMELRKIRRQHKIWSKIKIPVQLDTRGQLFVKLSIRKEEKDLLSFLKRGDIFFEKRGGRKEIF